MLEPDDLAAALDGVDVAHYLIHSMGRGGAGDFADRDKRAARNFGEPPPAPASIGSSTSAGSAIRAPPSTSVPGTRPR